VWFTELHGSAIDGENKESVVSPPLAFVFSMLLVESLTTSGSSGTDSMWWPRAMMRERAVVAIANESEKKLST